MAARLDHVELSKRTLRERAAAFAIKHADDSSEIAERQVFWNDLFGIFGREVKEVGRFERAVKRLSTGRHGWIDLLVPGDMAVEHKSRGENLDHAMTQLFDYLEDLQPAAAPWLVVACDFQTFFWQDLRAGTEGRFILNELPDHIELFWWLAGHGASSVFEDEEEANLVATGYMATLHDAVLASGYDPHALREWLTRILFCLFADDTAVWDKDAFKSHVFLNTRADGADLGPALAYLFQLLNTRPEELPANLDEDLAAFTYINGDLFATTLPIPSCDEMTRDALLAACKFDWSAISPAIFGSMFQNVMTPAERRHLGAHYTTEENILKTIRPMFVDALDDELAAIRVTSSAQSRAALNAFHDKLARLTFLDPACGCGNFLVIAYREIRRLETEVLRALRTQGVSSVTPAMDVAHFLKVTVDQFYGIEIEEFPARIARTALYLMDHKANREFSTEFGEYFARFPIPTSPHIRIDNALRIDWNDLLPAERASYVFGNPPFLGKQQRSDEQQEDMSIVFAGEHGTGVLDYVAAWYKHSIDYAGTHHIQFAYVSTNSITQGEQVPALWRSFYQRGFEITFAHRTFAWSSEARGRAHVHCVIVGFAHTGVRPGPHALFDYPDIAGEPIKEMVREINCYLAPGPATIVERRSAPFDPDLPTVAFGSMPNDGGGLILSQGEADRLRSSADAIAPRYLRKLVGADDLLNGDGRWCLWLKDARPGDITASPFLRERISAVREYRLRSSRAQTRVLAETPSLFGEIRQPEGQYLCIPRHSSESRRVVPMAFIEDGSIAHDSTLTVESAPRWLFAVLQSSMFMAWVRSVSGKLESRLRISAAVVYNTFPFPEMNDDQRDALDRAGRRILDVRANFPEATLADLYNPLAMPEQLVRVHDELDRLVVSIFAGRRLLTLEADRLGVLFERYEQLQSPLLATAATSRSRRTRR
jgi:hypothetical protein